MLCLDLSRPLSSAPALAAANRWSQMKRLVSPGSAPESCKAASDIRGLRGKWRLLHCAVYECVHVSASVVYACSHPPRTRPWMQNELEESREAKPKEWKRRRLHWYLVADCDASFPQCWRGRCQGRFFHLRRNWSFMTVQRCFAASVDKKNVPMCVKGHLEL